MLYRPQALAQLDSPDELRALMRITDPRGWLFLAALGVVTVVFLLWALFGSVSVQVRGRGLLLPPEGLDNLYAPSAGILESWRVHRGDRVEPEQVLATLAPLDGAGPPVELRARRGGQVLEVLAPLGSHVQPGETLLSLADAGVHLRAVLFLPAQTGSQLRVGMPALVEPLASAEDRYGMLVGEISWVAPYPSSERGMRRELENPELVRELAGDGAPLEVWVELQRDATSPDGYRWTSVMPVGPELKVGTLCRGSIVLRKLHPYQLVLRGGS